MILENVDLYKYLAVNTLTSESTGNPAHYMPAARQKITASYRAMRLNIPRHASYHYKYGLWYKYTTSAFFHRYHSYYRDATLDILRYHSRTA